MVGSGARGMVGVSFGLVPDEPRLRRAARRVPRPLRSAHDARDQGVRRHGAGARLARAAKALPWGIVTNKATRFAAPLVAALGLAERAAALVCGDTVAHSKPHPAPLLEAARRLGLAAGRTASTSATTGATSRPAAPPGWLTIVAAWGYLGDGDAPEAWGADHLIARPDELPGLIGGA